MTIRRALTLGTALLAFTILVSACGDDGATTSSPTNGSGTATSEGRVIDITVTDLAYSPSTISVTKGETITFRFTNNGKLTHEAVIGDVDFQMEHGVLMSSSTMSGMGTMTTDGHSSDHAMATDSMLTMKTGMGGEETYRFDKSGTYFIGCHQPGHYEAGMKATITVT